MKRVEYNYESLLSSVICVCLPLRRAVGRLAARKLLVREKGQGSVDEICTEERGRRSGRAGGEDNVCRGMHSAWGCD